MKSRAIFLSTPNRLKEVKGNFKIELENFYLNQYLFELSELSKDQIKSIQNLSKFYQDSIIIFKGSLNTTVLLQLQYHKINKNDSVFRSIEDEELCNFIRRTIKYFSDNLRPKWKVGFSELDFNQGPFIMGVLNVTPDSFSDGGKYLGERKAIEHALRMVEQGAHIIDVGGESTRPGADPVSLDQEFLRVLPVIKGIRRHSNVLISIDTYKSQVAKAALDSGADIINDISGSTFDHNMINVAREYDCPVIIMHIKGTPRDMQKDPFYGDVVEELYRYFEKQTAKLEEAGLDKIIIDPGIGFGKRLEDNLRLIRDLKDFAYFNRPILLGTSRKSFIGRILENEVDQRLSGTLASNLISIENGADIVRVHDVTETREAIEVLRAIKTV